jgi:ribose transport system permease protein
MNITFTSDPPTPTDKSDRARKARRLRLALVQSLGITAFLVVLMVVFSLLSTEFLTKSNLIGILSSSAFIGMVALGQTLVIIAGGFDLSVGGVAPLCAVIFAQFVNKGTPISLSIVIALAAGAAVGLGNGLIITKGRINPLITTLATLSIAGGLAFTITQGQSIPIQDLSAGFLANPSWLGLSNEVWLTVGMLVVITLVLRYTSYGRALFALGGNREASWLAGMRVDAVTTSTYVLSGMLAALGGVMLASQLLAGDGNLGTNASLLSVAAVVLGGGSLAGGIGSAPGTIAGVLVLGALSNGLTLMQVSSFYQQIVTGLVLLLAVAFSRLRSSIGDRVA